MFTNKANNSSTPKYNGDECVAKKPTMRSSELSLPLFYYVRDVEVETVINHFEAVRPDLPRPSLSGMSFTSSREG